MAEMRTDAATLRAEASNFDRISSELQTVIRGVESTGGELASHWRGQAGAAAQQALARFHEAGQQQIKALTDISQNIQGAGIQYSKADDEQAGSLSSQMNF
ncbi:WXG100 family type VII secretion target [Mycobacterium parmense]|uniref:ESAT-6-like protein n=1 Tax=Mycobacterium parmense TaxID=185642 RepID=A0A7I7Z196_9MYCO|nr:WXG100 family type VII secretion target [Mycobacterium parmense]MCV7352743.1 WXG100 family type VII secretion target [Mycobacterium parmense]ORW54653.1 type VII secretion protein EsxB [Mycobacterium parmense]BBZ46751.1 ESAT-6-like protein EsxB [Mycobacterium parmense]